MITDLAAVGYSVDTSGLRQGEAALDKFGKANEKADQGAKKLSKGVSAAGKAAETSSQAIAKAGGAVRDASGRFVRMGDTASKAAKETAKVGDEASKSATKTSLFAKAMGTLSGAAGKAVVSLKAKAVQLAKNGIALAAVTFGIAGMVGTLANFETQMSAVAAVSRASADDLATMRDMAKDLGSTTEFSASQAAEGFKFLSMAGFNAKQSIAALPSVLDLATAAQIGLGESADMASNIMSAFGIAAEDVSGVVDVLAAASSRANTSVPQLAQAMSTVAPVAKALGISLQETSAAIGVLSDAGLQGERAGTALQGVLASLAGPTNQAQAVLKQLGLTAADVNPEVHDLSTIMGRLKDANMSTAQAMVLFGREAAKGGLVLAESAARVGEFAEELGAVDGEGRRMAEMMRDNLGGSVNGLKSALEGLVIALGEAGLTAILRLVFDGATMMVRGITAAVNAFGSLVSALDFVTPTLSLISNNFQTFATYATVAAVALTAKYLPAAARLIASNVAAAASYTMQLIPAMFGFVRAIAASVLGLTSLRTALMRTGIGALIVLAGFLADMFIKLVQRTATLGEATVAFGDLAKLTWTAIGQSAKAIGPALAAVWAGVQSEFFRFIGTLQRGWGDFLRSMGSAAEWAGMEGVAGKLTAAAEQAYGAMDQTNLAAGRAFQTYMEKSEQAAAIVTDAFAPVMEKWEELRAKSEAAGDAAEDGAETAANALDGAAGAADNAGSAAEGAGNKGKEAAEKAAEATKQWASALQEELVRAVDGVSRAFGDWVTRGFRDFKSFTASILDAFKSMLSNMIAMAARNRIMISMGLDPLSGALRQAGAPAAGGAGGAAGGWLGSALGSFQAPAAGGLLGGIGGVWGGVSSGWAAGGIGGALSGGLGASMAGISSGLSMGGIAGITGALGAALPIIGGVVAVFAAGKALFGRKLKDTGIDATFDLAEGIAARTYKFYKGGLFRSNKTRYSDMDEEAANPIGQAFSAVGNSVKGFAEQLGLNAKKIDNLSWKINFSTKGMSEEDIQARFQEELEKYGEAAAKAVGGLNLKRFTKEGETSLQALERLSVSLGAFNGVAVQLGWSLNKVGLAGANASSRFIDLLGGLEQFTQATGFYYQNFYSHAERQAKLQDQLTNAFGDLGRNLPSDEAHFRRIVEQMESRGNMKGVAEMLKLAPAFIELLQMMEASDSAAMQEALDIAREREDLERRLAQATGDTNALRQMELAGIDKSNHALLRQIWAAEKAAEVAQQRASLEDQLLRVQGNTAEIRRRELLELDESNRALQQRIWALEDAAAVAAERDGLERRLLELQGNSAEIRRRELAGLDATNRALQERIWRLEKEQQIAEERRGLEEQLLQVMGNTAALRQLELSKLDASNRALQERIWAEEKAQAVSKEREGLEMQLLRLQENTVAIRALELAALDSSNRALQEQIWALEDQKKALDEQRQAEQAASEIAAERASLESSLAAVLGDTAFLRQKELAALDESNRALQLFIWGIEDAKENLQGAEQAAREAASAEQRRIDDLRASAASIRNLSQEAMANAIGATEAQRRSAEAQLRLALETGDVWSDQMSDLARQAASLDASNFGSYAEFLAASGRAAALLASVADAQDSAAQSEQERLEAALERYGLKEETVQSLDFALRNLDKAIQELADAQAGLAPRLPGNGGLQGPTVSAPAGGQQTQAAMQLTMDQLRDEIKRLREENNQGNAQIAKFTKQLADLQRMWQVEGMPPVREEV